jgi:short subunit dehydrogenase-like uncharacterized protein
LIAKALHRLELEFVMAGRDKARLQAAAQEVDQQSPPPTRVAMVHDRKSLAAAFDDATVVINCSGPFHAIGESVVEAALASGCHYLDTTGEQSYVRNVYEHFESAARKAERVVVNACAFEVGLGDWAANVARHSLEADIVDEIIICYAIERMQRSMGTRLSIIDAIGQPGFAWQDDRWVRSSPGAERRDIEFPEPFGRQTVLSFPSPETITVPRHSSAHRVQTYMSLGQDNPITRTLGQIVPVVSPVMTPVLGSIFRSGLGALAGSTLEAIAHEPQDIHDSHFALVAEARVADQVARTTIHGYDIYGVSAGIACLAAERLLNEKELCGVLAPSELLDPRDALEEIAEQHQLEVTFP